VTAKLFLEGQGLMIEVKCKNPKEKWKGVPVILTTNVLPSVMRPPKRFNDEEDYKFRERRNNHIAFMTRCRLTEITKSHRNLDVFPYDEDELALYMKHLCDTMNPEIEEEYEEMVKDDQSLDEE